MSSACAPCLFLCDVMCFVNIHIGLGERSLPLAAMLVYVTSLSREKF